MGHCNTVFVDVKPDMKIVSATTFEIRVVYWVLTGASAGCVTGRLYRNCQVRDEIFGPVLAVAKFSTEEEAIELANDTSYGLGAGLHSSTFMVRLHPRAVTWVPWSPGGNGRICRL